jgi:hypothetical protein
MPDPKYSIEGLRRYIDDRFATLCERDPAITALREENVSYADWEADWFLRGVRDLGLFDVDVHDCRSGFIAAGFTGDLFLTPSGTPRDAHFFSVAGRRGGGARVPAREGVTHMAAIAKLAGAYHHPADTIRSESSRFEVDIEVFDRRSVDPDASVILGAEVKVRAREHEALVAGMRSCRGSGDAAVHVEAVRGQLGRRLPATHASNHHKKCRWLVQHRAATFWVVSRELSSVFEARFPAHDTFELTALGDDALVREAVEKRAVQRRSSAAVP